MRTDWRVVVGTALTGVMMASSLTICAQQKESSSQRVAVQGQRVFQIPAGPDGLAPTPPPGDTFVFVSSEISFDGQPVKGAPYSAQAVNETTQTLSDGNRIVNKSTSAVYRDSDGRTRREQTLRSFGPFAATGEAPQMVFISDPVAGVNYTLDARTHVARKMPAFRFEFKTAEPLRRGEAPSGGVMFERAPGPPPPPGPPDGEGPGPEVFTLRAPPPGNSAEFVFKREGAKDKNLVTEKLGTQVIEGVPAEGTRDTITIPAGEIGNERAIEIVNERWYSPELKTVVMTRHSDPRFGETVYRLTNISRTEPPHSLFEVPADYTLKDEPPPGGMMRMRRPAPPNP